MNPLINPQFPFDGYEEADYVPMMDFILQVESVQAWRMGKWLARNLSPNSVIDIGCGPGIYLVPFILDGAYAFGVDACPVGGECLPENCFERVDLRFPYKKNVGTISGGERKFDLAICMEVAEHLHEKWAERLVDTLYECSDTVLFTGAVPGQGGTNHYNEQPHEYWLTMFRERHGYGLHPLQNELRAFLQTLPAYCSGWLKNNSFLLQR